MAAWPLETPWLQTTATSGRHSRTVAPQAKKAPTVGAVVLRHCGRRPLVDLLWLDHLDDVIELRLNVIEFHLEFVEKCFL